MAKLLSSMQAMGLSLQVRGLPFVNFIRTLKYSGLGLFFFFITQNAYAADVSTILFNLRKVIVPLTTMVLVICFVTGMFMIFNALAKMKKFGMMQTMMSQPGEIHGPLVGLVIGAMLVYLPTSTDFLMNSLFNSPASIFGGGVGTEGINYQAMGQGASLLSYSGSGGMAKHWSDLANTLVLFIQFLGFLSFIKGFLILHKAAAPGHQPGTFGKGMTHIIGGIILINFVGAVNILKNTIYGA